MKLFSIPIRYIQDAGKILFLSIFPISGTRQEKNFSLSHGYIMVIYLERLKDLRVSEKRMSLQELSDATGIPSSTLGNYEKDKNIDMSLGNLITLANFYNISTDYLLCRTELRKHKNQSVSDLHLNDDAVQILTDEKYNPRLLSELLTHENF